MEIKKRPQRASYEYKGTSRKCEVCNSWKKKQPDGELLCLTCHFRNKQKEQVERAEENAAAPIKPNVKIGSL